MVSVRAAGEMETEELLEAFCEGVESRRPQGSLARKRVRLCVASFVRRHYYGLKLHEVCDDGCTKECVRQRVERGGRLIRGAVYDRLPNRRAWLFDSVEGLESLPELNHRVIERWTQEANDAYFEHLEKIAGKRRERDRRAAQRQRYFRELEERREARLEYLRKHCESLGHAMKARTVERAEEETRKIISRRIEKQERRDYILSLIKVIGEGRVKDFKPLSFDERDLMAFYHDNDIFYRRPPGRSEGITFQEFVQQLESAPKDWILWLAGFLEEYDLQPLHPSKLA